MVALLAMFGNSGLWAQSHDLIHEPWGIQQTPFLYHGCSLNQKNFVSMYRWHLPDPIAWRQQARITIQQIGLLKGKGKVETVDDWSCATFWYEPSPSAPLPPMPDGTVRTADIWQD
jgi:hypothetical protein